ncbi:MAG: hypothetical protein ACRDBO_15430, partial [Lachnospiraceae bacterium]
CPYFLRFRAARVSKSRELPLNTMPETPELAALKQWPFLALTRHFPALRDSSGPAKAENTDRQHSHRQRPQAFLVRQPPATYSLPLMPVQLYSFYLFIVNIFYFSKLSITILMFFYLMVDKYVAGGCCAKQVCGSGRRWFRSVFSAFAGSIEYLRAEQ